MVMVRIMGVKRYMDRHGTPRAYWRRKGAPSVPIDPGLTGAQLAAEVARLEKKHLAPVKARAGTLRQLIADYKSKSDHWRGLRPRTRKDYERVFAWLGAAVDVAAGDVTAVEIARTRDKARDQHGVKFANQVMTTIEKPFRWGLGAGQVRINPVVGLERAKAAAVDEEGNEIIVEKRGNRPCTPAEAVALLRHAPPKLLPAIATAIYFCLREGDTIALQKSSRTGNWITTLQSKTRRAGKAARPVTGYVCDDYARILDAVPANDATTICVKLDGTPWSLEGFKTEWGRFRDSMLKRELIGPGVTFHGLRHTGPTILENNGFDETQTRHLLGHGPRSVSGHYAVTAERKKLLMDMALTVQRVLRKAEGNVVRIGNGTVYPRG